MSVPSGLFRLSSVRNDSEQPFMSQNFGGSRTSMIRDEQVGRSSVFGGDQSGRASVFGGDQSGRASVFGGERAGRSSRFSGEHSGRSSVYVDEQFRRSSRPSGFGGDQSGMMSGSRRTQTSFRQSILELFQKPKAAVPAARTKRGE